MNIYKFYPLVFAENYYISENGYVFYMKHSIRILPELDNNDIIVRINNKKYSLFNLMLEYFFESSEVFKYDFIFTTDKKRPLTIPKRLIKKSEEKVIESTNDFFKCKSKVSTANRRSKEQVSKSDIVKVLVRDNYSCVYCGLKIKGKTWHLDHVKPLSKNGKNEFSNLATSCKTCNLMKNSMMKDDFIARCGTIYKKYKSEKL